MNNKLKLALTFLFCAACCLGMLTDMIFPLFMYFMKFLIIISVIALVWTSAVNIHRYFKALNRKKKETVYNLIFKSGIRCSIVNMLTVYRMLIAPALLYMLFTDMPAFKWILLSAFITDALDGFLARRWKVTTKLGAYMDSLADDFIFIVSLIAIISLHTQVIIDNLYIIGGMIFLFLVKMIFLYFKHKKIISGLHTYSMKTAAFFQALFFLHCIFFYPNNPLFYITAIITMVALTEEVIIILYSRELKQNMKGLFF